MKRTKKNGKNGTFFWKERKRTERSFEKNGCTTLLISGRNDGKKLKSAQCRKVLPCLFLKRKIWKSNNSLLSVEKYFPASFSRGKYGKVIIVPYLSKTFNPASYPWKIIRESNVTIALSLSKKFNPASYPWKKL